MRGGSKSLPDLNVLARFLPELERPDFSPGHWTETRRLENGAFELGYAVLSQTASEFMQAAYDSGWVLKGFNWPDWCQTDEAIQLLRGPERLAQATQEQLAKVLTVVIRQDRFAEGALIEYFANGYIRAIVRRAAELRDAGGVSDAM
jgi:hypothetical protein